VKKASSIKIHTTLRGIEVCRLVDHFFDRHPFPTDQTAPLRQDGNNGRALWILPSGALHGVDRIGLLEPDQRVSHQPGPILEASERPGLLRRAGHDVGTQDRQARYDVFRSLAFERLDRILGGEFTKFRTLDSGVQPSDDRPSSNIAHERQVVPGREIQCKI
jgi:hypothetical protein